MVLLGVALGLTCTSESICSRTGNGAPGGRPHRLIHGSPPCGRRVRLSAATRSFRWTSSTLAGLSEPDQAALAAASRRLAAGGSFRHTLAVGRVSRRSALLCLQLAVASAYSGSWPRKWSSGVVVTLALPNQRLLMLRDSSRGVATGCSRLLFGVAFS